MQQRDDLLQQVAPEILAVLHADAIELGHVEQRGRVVVAVQAVLVGVQQGIAQHAAVAQQVCLLVDEAECGVLFPARRCIHEGAQLDEDADDLAVLTDGKFCRADFLEAVSNINLLAHAQQRGASAHDGLFCLVGLLGEQLPAELFVGPAADLGDITDAAGLEEGAAGPAETVLAVLPEGFDIHVLEHGRKGALVQGACPAAKKSLVMP